MDINVNTVGNDQDSRYNQFWKDMSSGSDVHVAFRK